MKFSLFLALFVLGSARAVDQAAQSKEEARMLRNPQELEVDIHGHRELWGSGFSWNNLLFQAHICGDPSDNCPHAPGLICGCPDCCKPVPPHIKHGYCKSHPCGTSGDSDSDAEATGSGNGGGTNAAVDQEPTRRSTLWMYVAGAAGLAGIGAAWMMRRRMVAAAAGKKGLTEDEEDEEAVEMSNKGLSEFDDEMGGSYSGGSFAGAAQAARLSARNLGLMVGGAAAAAAGAVGIAALSRRSNESETGEAVTGSVSRRYGMMADGDGSVGSPYDDSGARPEFIEVAPRSYYAAPAVISTSARGIEVEGPLRPSSQYTI